MLCPVCLQDASAADGVVGEHYYTVRGATRPCPMSGKEPFRWDERSTRAAVPARSGGRCEYCGVNKATNMHHRINASQGGWWSPANILHLCGSGTTGCHGHFTQHPAEAYALGISVSFPHENPADIAVQTRNGLLWVTDDVAPPIPGWAR